MNRRHAVAIAAVVTFLLPLLAGQGAAEAPKEGQGPETYRIDAVHSSNCFRIKHMNVAWFYGRFNELEGTIVYSEADPAACSFDVRIKADSIDTNNADRDKHLKSADFFEVEKYPELTFKSRSAKKLAESTLEVTGDLTLHGVTKPLTVKIEHTGSGPGMRGEHRAGFETTFEIKRTDYGMTKLLGGVGDEVRITVSLEAVRQ